MNITSVTKLSCFAENFIKCLIDLLPYILKIRWSSVLFLH